MKYIAGFIGIGNMGGALLEAVCKAVDSKSVSAFDVNTGFGKNKTDLMGASFTTPEEISKNSKYLFMGVKPNVIRDVLSEISGYITPETVIVSMAAGVSINDIAKASGTERIIRIMPNTPVTVCKGTILYTCGKDITDEDVSGFLSIMKNAGQTDCIDEKLIDAAAALSGCGPAFVYMFIEALADGAVKCGLPRDKALLYAKQTVAGSAEYALASEKHPEKLKDDVCSPGGTTIEGVLALEKGSFRHTAASAVVAAFEKTKLL